MDSAAELALVWKLAHALWLLLFTLAAFLLGYIWKRLEAVWAKVHQMELLAVTNNVTKAELREVMREFVSPINSELVALNKDVRAIVKALAAQSIHVERDR